MASNAAPPPIGIRSVTGGFVSKRSVTGPSRNVAQKSRAPAVFPSMPLKAKSWP